MSTNVIEIVEVTVEIINVIVGRFMLKIFLLRGCTITISFGRRKYASEERICLSCKFRV